MFLYPQKGDVITIKNYNDKPLLVIEGPHEVEGKTLICTPDGCIPVEEVKSILCISGY